jgi:predicted ATPase
MATEASGEAMTPEQKCILRVLEFLRSHQRLPTTAALEIDPTKDDFEVWQTLFKKGFLEAEDKHVALTLAGLLKYGGEEALAERERFERLLPHLRTAYQTEPEKFWTVEELGALAGMSPQEVSSALTFFAGGWGLEFWDAVKTAPHSDRVNAISLAEEILNDRKLQLEMAQLLEEDELRAPLLSELQVGGYRALEGFQARLTRLTVIIGANASGKSSLFDLLALPSFAAQAPLPPEVDPRSVGKALFHLGAPERIEWRMRVEREEARPLQYSVRINGPLGRAEVATERLVSLESGPEGRESEVFKFLEFRNGAGTVQSVSRVRQRLEPASWTLSSSSELALRRALDPELVTLNGFRDYLASWGFYSGFAVGMADPIRRPVFTETAPVLKADGSNLSAVLFHLFTEHRERWEELETHLRSAIPAFQAINIKSRGGPGMIMSFWREAGVSGELTLADLSDGTLKFLCWATLCLSPRKPPLICIDEPEIGLHPRVLPVLAGLLRQASAESQLLVSTHSPYFLSQFSLEEIAVMKKVEGRAVFARPASNEALRREVEELGGDLAWLHISDELEVRS